MQACAVMRGELGAPRRVRYEDGREEIRFDGELPTLDQMAAARQWLADRGWGRAPEIVRMETRNLTEAHVDLRQLNTDQIRLLMDVVRTAAPELPPKPEDK